MKYIVVGASAAGISAIETIRKYDKDAQVILVSKDTAIYSRCILHHYMKGKRSLEKLCFVNPNFIENYQVIWKKGLEIMAVNPEKKTIELSNGEKLSYDGLLLATGSTSFFPPIAGLKEAKNAIGFHDFSDCVEILKQVKSAKHVVVMGAGLVGMDAVSGLLESNVRLTIVEMKDRMLAMQLDKRAAKAYEEAFAKQGVRQYYNTGISKVLCDDGNRITSIELSSGEKLPCDLLIVAAGVRANVSYLKGSGIETDKLGLVIDCHGRTNTEFVYGAGDVTGRNPIWSVAVKEGIIAASNMSGVPREMTDFFGSKSTMNFLGIPTLSLGICDPPDDSYQVQCEEDGMNYKKVIYKEGVIYGAIIQGDLSYAGVLTQLIRTKTDVSQIDKPLFKVDYSDFFQITESLQYTYD